MRPLLYLVSVLFLCDAATGVASFGMLAALLETRSMGATHPRDFFAAASVVFLWVSSIARPMVSLALGVYVLMLAGRYQQNPRRAVRAFLQVIGITLVLFGSWFAALMEFLRGEPSLGALVWGVPPIAVGALVLVMARRYSVTTARPETG